MNEDINVEELLNSFVDGELSQRQETEVKRLIKHDPEAARVLDEIQMCRSLLTSLPNESAPDGTLDEIKTTLERRTLLDAQSKTYDERAGAKHLFMRKALSYAAMFILVGILAGVIYNIISTEEVEIPHRLVLGDRASAKSDLPEKNSFTEAAVTPRKRTREELALQTQQHAEAGPVDSQDFTGIKMNLEIQTDNLPAVAASINRAIIDNISTEQLWVPVTVRQARRKAMLDCSAEELQAVLADMQGMWRKFESATLTVRYGHSRKKNLIEQVIPSQILAMGVSVDVTESTQIVAEHQLFNGINKSMPGRQILAMLDGDPEEITIPKPVLTSHQASKKSQSGRDRNIHLVIDVIESSQ